MAELDQQPISPDGEPEVLVVEESPLVIPANRPRKVYAGMWGPIEIGVLSAGTLALIMAFAAYFFWVVPSNRELARNKADADRLDAEVTSARSKYGEMTNTQASVDKLVASVDDFETHFLPIQSNGQTALYQRLNGLIKAYGLENTSGPDYAPLDPASQKSGEQADNEKGRTKFRSLYPGVYVTTTLEGSYQNLRRFIREIETGRDFVVISAVELAPSDTEAGKEPAKTGPYQNVNPQNANPVGPNPIGKGFVQPPAGPNAKTAPPLTQGPPRQKGKAHGEIVSLHLEMAAYFRRPGFVPTSAP